MIAILIVVIAAIVCFFIWRWIVLKPYNQKPLEIETFDGFASPYHPSVLFFENRWNGWRYWMAETPFSPYGKPYRDRNECPSIHVSDDGVNWQTPTGLKNPIVDLGKEQIRNMDYFSDPQLLFVDGKLECFYRLTRRHGRADDFSDVSLWRISSFDGKRWGEPEELIRPKFAIVSPGMTYDAIEGYRIWFVDSENHYSQRGISFALSPDAKEWTSPVACSLKGHQINPWHIDVCKIGDFLYLTVYDYNEISLWRGLSDSPTEFEYVETLLKPAVKKYGSFYSNGLYRACIVETDNGIELFFSADDSEKTYIGRLVSKSTLIEPGIPIDFRFSGKCGYHSSFPVFIKKTVFGYWRWGIFIIRNYLRKFK